MESEIKSVISSIGASHALVEAAHVYEYESVFDEHMKGATIGTQVVDMLHKLGVSTSTMLFVDDYNHHQPSTDQSYAYKPDVYLQQLASVGYAPEQTVTETGVAIEAEGWIMKHVAEGKLKATKNGIILPLGADGVMWIAKKFDSRMHFMCEALDACLYVKKAEQADLLVTVLPISYKVQQDKTKKLLSVLGYRLPILNVYFDEKEKLVVDFNY